MYATNQMVKTSQTSHTNPTDRLTTPTQLTKPSKQSCLQTNQARWKHTCKHAKHNWPE